MRSIFAVIALGVAMVGTIGEGPPGKGLMMDCSGAEARTRDTWEQKACSRRSLLLCGLCPSDRRDHLWTAHERANGRRRVAHVGTRHAKSRYAYG